MNNVRYFLDQDGDGHWYVIPENREVEWRAWVDEYDLNPVPDGVEAVGGWPGLVRFENPVIE